MSVQLARYLKDFGTPPRPQPAFMHNSTFGQAGDLSGEALFDISQAEPEIDVEAERAQAYAAGRAEAEEELTNRHHAETDALRSAHAAELAELRKRLEQQAAAMVSERFALMAETLADLLAGQTAAVLAPVLDETMTRKAIADLATMIRAGIGGGEGITVTVKGPLHLFEQLKSHFEEAPPVFRHLEASDLDLVAEFGETVLVTRIAAWADTVRKVLA